MTPIEEKVKEIIRIYELSPLPVNDWLQTPEAKALIAGLVEDWKDGVGLIAAERNRQITKEGWTLSHDAGHDDNELAYAAAAYALPESLVIETDLGSLKYERERIWPWEEDFKPSTDNRIRELVKAGALIAAEIDRLKNSNQ